MAKISNQSNGASPTPRESHWRAVSRAWEKSGLSQAVFCRRRGYSFFAFHHWRGELRRREQLRRAKEPKKPRPMASGSEVPGFAEVRVAPTGGGASWPVEIALPDGRVIRVARNADSETIRKVFGVLEGAGMTAVAQLEEGRTC